MEGKLQYTTINHIARKKLKITCNDYCIADSIHQLSRPWCEASRKYLGKFIGVSERSAINIISKLVEKGIVEKNEEKQLKTTEKWFETVIVEGEKSSPRTMKKVQSGGEESSVNNNNNNISISKDIDRESVFDLKGELKKLEDSPRRDLNILAWFYEEKSLSPTNKEQWRNLLTRYIKTAGKLKTYTDAQLVEASKKVKEKYEDWTLETILKWLTK